METEYEILSRFFSRIWRNEQGYVYLATKDKFSAWHQYFFNWPADELQVIQFTLEQRTSQEVYFAPSLFSEPSSKKEACKGAFVYWVEFDGNIVPDLETIPPESIRVQTSSETHLHLYWCTESLVEPSQLESINRALTYLLKADASGWDCNQVLRPPETLNHRKQKKTFLKHFDPDSFVTSIQFKNIPAPPPLELPVPAELPPLEEIIVRWQFTKDVWKLYRDGVPVGSRSEGLMALGYYLAEMNLSNAEMYVMLESADSRWGKFAKRSDKVKRLMEIVTRARLKYPFKAGQNEDTLVSVGWKELLATEIELEWVWEGLLQQGGYLLLTGPTGAGKTQFSLDLSANLVLRTGFLGRSIPKRRKIGFFSLEMGHQDLKWFLQHQNQYTEEEQTILEEYLRFYPLGEPIYMNRESEKMRIERAIENEGLDGIIIDSLGSTTSEELTSEAQVKNLMDWNDRLRSHYGIFTGFIHHHRKAQTGNKKPNKLSDVYGSQYITARATTVLCLWDTGVKGIVELIPLKVRLSPKQDAFFVQKDNHLHFSIPTVTPKVIEKVLEESAEDIDLTEEAVSDTVAKATQQDLGSFIEGL